MLDERHRCFPMLRQQTRSRRRREAQPLARRLPRAARERDPRPPRRVRRDGRPRRRRARRTSSRPTNDDYRAIMVKALADRLAEAFAEYLHQRGAARLGLRARSRLAPEELVEERYRGIRPAFGYPACPDHSAEAARCSTCSARRASAWTLTENGAMLPAASVSGLYFAHPQARYFNVGRLGKDQVEDYARRTRREPLRGRALAAREPRVRAGRRSAPQRWPLRRRPSWTRW